MRKLSVLSACALLIATLSCVQPTTNQTATNSSASGEAAFKTVHDAYVREFLRRFPVVNTYLGGGGLDPSLREVDGWLRDHSATALAAEDQWLAETQRKFEGIDAASLSPASRIDREVALAQVKFLLREHQTRSYQERAGCEQGEFSHRFTSPRGAKDFSAAARGNVVRGAGHPSSRA